MRKPGASDIVDLMGERHDIILEARRILRGALTISDEERLIGLLRQLSMLRKTIVEKVRFFNAIPEGEYVKGYYETVIEYISLVDGEMEEELLLRVLERARNSKGALARNLDWLEAEYVSAHKYRLGSFFSDT